MPPGKEFTVFSIAWRGKKVKRELIFLKKCDILDLLRYDAVLGRR
jgi:hypothetical protein